MDGSVHDWVISRPLWWGHQILLGTMLRVKWHTSVKSPRKVTDGLRMKTSWIRGSVLPLAILNHGLAGCRLRRLQTLLPDFSLGNRLWHHLLAGVSYDLPIFRFTGRPTIPKMSLSRCIRDEQDAKVSNLSVTGLIQWMWSRNTVPMPTSLVPFKLVDLHQGKTCASLTKNGCILELHQQDLEHLSTSSHEHNEGLISRQQLPM